MTNQPTNENDSRSPDSLPLQMESSLPPVSEGNEAAPPDAAQSQEKKDIKGGIDFIRPCHGGRRFYFKDGSVAVLMDDGITLYEHVGGWSDKQERAHQMQLDIERWIQLKRWTPKTLDQQK